MPNQYRFNTTMNFQYPELEALLKTYLVLLGLFSIVAIYAIIVNACIYKKAGRPWWNVLIPFYALYVKYDIALENGVWFLLELIPTVGVIAGYYCNYKMCRQFRKSDLFCVLGIFFPIITQSILAFGEDQYKDQNHFYQV